LGVGRSLGGHKLGIHGRVRIVDIVGIHLTEVVVAIIHFF